MDCVTNRHLSVGMFKKLLVYFLFFVQWINLLVKSNTCDENESNGSLVAREGSEVRVG